MKRLIKSMAALALPVLVGVPAFGASIEIGTNDGANEKIFNDTRWTRDNVYYLKEPVYVIPPATLTIEPGTVIRGVPGNSSLATTQATGDNSKPGALILCRGAKLIAKGTPDDPIIFTSVGDPWVAGEPRDGAAVAPGSDILVPASPYVTINGTVNGASTAAETGIYSPDGPSADVSNAFSVDAKWGGVVILGECPIGYDGNGNNDGHILAYNATLNTYNFNATVNATYPNGDSPFKVSGDVKGGNGIAIANIEGIERTFDSLGNNSYTDPFPGAVNPPGPGQIMLGSYGGLDRDDNSGVQMWASSRFGGYVLGEGNEINGFTWGAPGSATTVEWLESYNNADDGFEYFGGAIHGRYLFSLFAGDDGHDGDQGFFGTLQNIFTVGDNVSGTRSGWATNNTATARPTTERSDNLAEWDGAEMQGFGVTPNTDGYAYNFTFIHGTFAGRDAIRTRRDNAGRWYNGVIQNVPDQAFRTGEANSTIADYVVYANVGNAAGIWGTTFYRSQNGTAQLNEVANSTLLAYKGLDIRLAGNATARNFANFNLPANRTDSYPYSGWTPLKHAGVARDNNMLKGWSVLDQFGLVADGNVPRPEIDLTVNSSNQAEVSFNASGSVLYVVEASADKGRSWTPFAVVQDGGLTYSAPGFVTTDSNASVGTIRVVDTVNGALTASAERRYRVIPQ